MVAGLAAYPAAATERQPYVVAGLGGAALAVAIVALALRRGLVVAWALVLVGGEYALFLRLRADAADAAALFVAAGLFVAAELAFGAVAAEGGRRERAAAIAESVTLVAVGVAAALAAGFLLLVAGSTTSGIALETLGALAAVGAVTALVRAAARQQR